MNLSCYIGAPQLSVMRSACRGEEGEYFRAMIAQLKATIQGMPKTYETDGQGDEALATLHYFTPSSDWWIVEKDAGGPDDETPGAQLQAFGLACLNGDWQNAESGYISIHELIAHGAELDLYFTPQTVGAIKVRRKERRA